MDKVSKSAPFRLFSLLENSTCSGASRLRRIIYSVRGYFGFCFSCRSILQWVYNIRIKRVNITRQTLLFGAGYNRQYLLISVIYAS